MTRKKHPNPNVEEDSDKASRRLREFESARKPEGPGAKPDEEETPAEGPGDGASSAGDEDRGPRTPD